MESLEQLKKEQYDAKAKLHELLETINSEEYYTLTPSERNLINQRRMALEMYVNALSRSVYDSDGYSFDASGALWPLLMSGVFSNMNTTPSSVDTLKKALDEKDFEDESGHDD